MYQPPTVTIRIDYPGTGESPSLFDISILSGSTSGALFPAVGTVYAGWCLDKVSHVYVPGVYSAAVYSSYEAGILGGSSSPIGDNPYAIHLDSINWLLNHRTLPGHEATFGEVQSAIWKLLGQDWTSEASYLGAVDPASVDTLAALALTHQGYVPEAGEKIGVVLDPIWAGVHEQPQLIELRASALGDRVWDDRNGDGRQDADETGIAGATVKLVRDLDGDGAFTGPNEVLATTVTDASGAYVFKGLTPGLAYQVLFETPAGYDAASPRQADGLPLSGVDSDGRLSDVVVLSSGEYRPTIDAGFYRHASLGDRVWLDANANGRQDAGEAGLGGLTVRLVGGGADGLVSTTGDNTLATTVTAADGSYRFDGLTPGVQYQVQFTRPDGSVFTGWHLAEAATDSDADATTGKSQVVTLTSGEYNSTLDAGIYQTASLGDRVWLDANANGRQDAGEAGLGGLTVRLVGGGADGLVSTAGDNTLATTVTAADGSYRFDGLTPGVQYQVQFTKPDGSVYTGWHFAEAVADSDADAASGKSQIVTLASGEYNSTLDAGIYQTASLGDRVWLDANANGRQDAGETGLGGLTVRLVGGGADGLVSTTGDNTLASTVTAADGSYRFDGLTPGVQYQVQFTKPDGSVYTGWHLAEAATDSDAATGTGLSQIVTLSAGENNTTLDAGIYSTASIGDKVWFDCNGNGLQDSGEAGVANVTVSLLDAGGKVVATQATDASGNYLFTGLVPGSYALQFGAFAGYSLTRKDAGADGIDSDADPTTGRTAYTTLVSGQVDRSWDAGLTAVCREVNFDFSYAGTASTDGTDGNSRTYADALTGVSVTARAFSQDKGTDSWQKAYLGAYGGGLGVTDSSEGTGGNNSHEIDNVGRNNYVVLQFSQQVTFDKAYLAAVVNDSDAQVWIGNSATSITTMSNAVLASLGYTEVNTTTLTTARWADFNIGGVTGNVVIVAADTTDTTPEDYFKLQQVSVCAPDCAPPVAKASIGDLVWEDKNYNGVQDAGEAGIANVAVKLLNAAGTVLATTTTDATGHYLFGNLNPADYKVQVVAPSGWFVTRRDQGANDALDSDVDATGTTAITHLDPGEKDLSWDAGLYRKASVGDKVWEDKNHNGLQDVGEPGVGNVRVTLLDGSGATVLGSTTTNSSGIYSFANLNPGSYMLQFDKGNVMYGTVNLNDWKWGVKNVGSNDAIDSDVNGDGISKVNVTRTDAFTLVSGQSDLTRDATVTPLVIDLDGNGIHTVARVEGGPTFDLFGNGHAVASGWIGRGDGFLAVDRNGNGRIDDIGELFGGTARGAGFARLADYDSNGDGVVDASDAAFGELRIWRDDNGNHVTDDGELTTLAQAGVASLGVATSICRSSTRTTTCTSSAARPRSPTAARWT